MLKVNYLYLICKISFVLFNFFGINFTYTSTCVTPIESYSFGDKTPFVATYSPDGKYVACLFQSISNPNSYITVLDSVNPNGTLTLVFEAADPEAEYAVNLVYSPNGKYLAVANLNSFNVTVWSVQSDGTLSSIGNYSTGCESYGIAYSTDNTQLAVTCYSNSGTLQTYTVNSNGSLTLANTYPVGTYPEDVKYSPVSSYLGSNRFLVVTNNSSDNINVFQVNGDNTLTEVSQSPFTTGSSPKASQYSPDGKFVAVANYSSNNVNVFSVDPTSGNLTEISGSPFFIADNYYPTDLAYSPDGKYLSVACQFGAIAVFEVGSDGSLSNLNLNTNSQFYSMNSIAYSPNSKYLVTASNNDNNILVTYRSSLAQPSISSIKMDCSGKLTINGIADPTISSQYPITISATGSSIVSSSTITDDLGNFQLNLTLLKYLPIDIVASNIFNCKNSKSIFIGKA